MCHGDRCFWCCFSLKWRVLQNSGPRTPEDLFYYLPTGPSLPRFIAHLQISAFTRGHVGFYLFGPRHAPGPAPLTPPPTWRQKMFGWTLSRSRREEAGTFLGSISVKSQGNSDVFRRLFRGRRVCPTFARRCAWRAHLPPEGWGCHPAEVAEIREPPSAQISSCSRAEDEKTKKMDGGNSEREREKLPPIYSSAVTFLLEYKILQTVTDRFDLMGKV